jgi:hypothetical protein
VKERDENRPVGAKERDENRRRSFEGKVFGDQQTELTGKTATNVF